MVSKELIKSEIDKVPVSRFDELYAAVKNYSEPIYARDGRSLMSKLREITIDGPEDFSESINLY